MELEAAEQRKSFGLLSKELIAVFVAIILQTGSGLWWASDLTARVGFLEEQANKGDRFTAKQGTEQDRRLRVLENESISVLRHMENHNETAKIWIDQIKNNTKMVQENNSMLRYLTGKTSNGD